MWGVKYMDEKEKKETEIEVVTGNGSEIEISEVKEHLTALKPKTKSEKDMDKKKIVIPEVKKVVIDES